MLLRFSAENHLSIREPVELSFVATSLKEFTEKVIPSRYSKHGVLPVVAVYGANASGKSNLLLAIQMLRSMVLYSFTHGEDRKGVPQRPFRLDDESPNKPTTFILDFVLSDVRYQFGVSFDKSSVIEEWLFTFPKMVQQMLYTRKLVDGAYEYHTGRSLLGGGKQIQAITGRSSLFLSAAAKSNHPVLSEISDYFKNRLIFKLDPEGSSNFSVAAQLSADSDLLKNSISYLGFADTGIIDLKVESIALSPVFKSSMQDLFKAISKVSLGDAEPSVEGTESSDADQVADDYEEFPAGLDKRVKFGHVTATGETKYFDINEESLGTKYLLNLLPSMLLALKNGGVLVLDEITTSLHTLLAKKLVSIFMEPKTNPLGAQLVFTTHDTNLLAPGLLRRDSVWFAEKSKAGVTVIFPLTDIPTKNTDNIERGYIQGRFGAIPFLRDVVAVE